MLYLRLFVLILLFKLVHSKGGGSRGSSAARSSIGSSGSSSGSRSSSSGSSSGSSSSWSWSSSSYYYDDDESPAERLARERERQLKSCLTFKEAYNTKMAILADSGASQSATLPLSLNGIAYYFGHKNHSGIFGSQLCVADVDELLHNLVPYDTTASNEYKDGNELMANMTVKPVYKLNTTFYEPVFSNGHRSNKIVWKCNEEKSEFCCHMGCCKTDFFVLKVVGLVMLFDLIVTLLIMGIGLWHRRAYKRVVG